MMKSYQAAALDFHTVTVVPEVRLVVTKFRDGAEAYAVPHDTEDYRAHAARSGVGDDVDTYCLQHDLAHVMFGEMLGGESPVLRSVAGRDAKDYPADQLDREEEIAKLLQAYCNKYGWPARVRSSGMNG